MAPAPPPPAARRGQLPLVVTPLLLGGLAILLSLGAAAAAYSASASLGGGSSRPSATTAARASAATVRFRSVPRQQPSPSAAAGPPLAPSSSNAAVALPSRRLVAPFVLAVPASRHLVAYPDDDEWDVHGGAGDASRAEGDAGRVATRASGEGAASPATASLVRLAAAFAAAPTRRRRHLLEYVEPWDNPHAHGGAGGAAAAAAGAAGASGEGAADTFDTSVAADPPQPTPSASAGISAPPPPEAVPLPPPPPPARCMFVTYIGGGAGTVELAHDGEERVFVVRERTGSSNISHAAPLVVSSDEESDFKEDESDCCEDYGGGEFSNAVDKFCRVVGHAVTAFDKAPWLFRLWANFRGA